MNNTKISKNFSNFLMEGFKWRLICIHANLTLLLNKLSIINITR